MLQLVRYWRREMVQKLIESEDASYLEGLYLWEIFSINFRKFLERLE